MPGPRWDYPDLDLSGTSAPLDYPDDTMSSGTLALLDFVSPTGRPQTAIGPGVPLRNYADMAVTPSTVPTGYVRGNPTYSGGIVLTGTVPASYVGLPPAFYPSANALTAFLYTFWSKQTGVGVGNFTNRLVTIASGATEQFALGVTADGSFNTTNFEVIFPGIDVSLVGTGFIPALFNGAVHQHGYEYVPHPTDGTMAKFRVYLDGALFYESGYVTRAAFATPSTGNEASFGGKGYNGTINGTVYRARIDNVAAGFRSAADTVRADYAANAGRFV